jgi:hypothetical protein
MLFKVALYEIEIVGVGVCVCVCVCVYTFAYSLRRAIPACPKLGTLTSSTHKEILQRSKLQNSTLSSSLSERS